MCVCVLGCNNGVGGGNFSKVKRLVQKWIGTRKRLFSRFSSFLPRVWDFRTQELFPRTYFTHKTTYSYLSLLIGCWNIQENLDADLFWAGDGRFCGDFPPFCVFARRIKSCHFFNCVYTGKKKHVIENKVHYVYTHTNISVCTLLCIYVYTYMCMYIYICIYVYICTLFSIMFFGF